MSLLEEWEAQEPAPGFSARVAEAARLRAEQRKARKRRRMAASAGAALFAAVLMAAAVSLWIRTRSESDQGFVQATERVEVPIGRRAVAVLEPGSRVSWKASVVEQERGDVFYRVEKGGAFEVNTAAGRVQVLGTCFRVRATPPQDAQEATTMGLKRDTAMLASGAALTAVTLITVYEGRVLAAGPQGKHETMLAGGDAARLDNNGVHKLGNPGLGSAASTQAPTGSEPGPYAEANERLGDEIRGLNQQLRGLATQKQELEQKLTVAQERLNAVNDGAVIDMRNEFDLSQDDWAKLAAERTIKFQTPCLRSEPFKPDAETLNKLGLAPEDGDTLQKAYEHSNKRVNEVVGRLCTQAVGSADVARVIGRSCEHVVMGLARDRDPEATEKAREQVGLIRAGKMPAPEPGTPMHPVLELFLALTGEMPRFEAELAQTFGPEEAHRIAYSDGLCTSSSTWSGRKRMK